MKFAWSKTTSGNVDYQVINVENGLTGTLTDSHSSYGFSWYDIATKTWKSNTTKSGEITNLTSTSYHYYPTTLTDTWSGKWAGLNENSKEYKTLFFNKSGTMVKYWLASKSTGILKSESSRDYLSFSMRAVRYDESTSIYDVATMDSIGHVWSYDDLSVRPVVSLKHDVELEYDNTNAYYDIK